MNSKVSLSTLYRREYLFTIDQDPENLNPFQVVFRALSVRDLDFIRALDTQSANQINLILLERGVLRYVNAYYTDGTIVPPTDLNILPIQTRTEIAQTIYEVSTITNEVISKINMNVTLAMDSKFSTDTWKCSVCKERGIDTARNCKFREDYDKIFDKDFKVILGNITYDHCPMYYKDNELVSDIFNAYYSWDKGVLPELGGVPEQTEFFGVAVNVVKKFISDLEASQHK
jgi:hypothetical protein